LNTLFPKLDGEALIQQFCLQPLIEKTRYRIPVGDHIWEVDEFAGDNEGLILAEIELSHEAESFVAPALARTRGVP
jgi:adenylate cyclase